MVDGKKDKLGGTAKPGAAQRAASGLTRPGDLYMPGDSLPLPEVVEKNSDSVWALWSDMVEGDTAKRPAGDGDFKETVPMDLDAMEPTQLMGLPELDDEKDRER